MSKVKKLPQGAVRLKNIGDGKKFKRSTRKDAAILSVNKKRGKVVDANSTNSTRTFELDAMLAVYPVE